MKTLLAIVTLASACFSQSALADTASSTEPSPAVASASYELRFSKANPDCLVNVETHGKRTVIRGAHGISILDREEDGTVESLEVNGFRASFEYAGAPGKRVLVAVHTSDGRSRQMQRSFAALANSKPAVTLDMDKLLARICSPAPLTKQFGDETTTVDEFTLFFTDYWTDYMFQRIQPLMGEFDIYGPRPECQILIDACKSENCDQDAALANVICASYPVIGTLLGVPAVGAVAGLGCVIGAYYGHQRCRERCEIRHRCTP